MTKSLTQIDKDYIAMRNSLITKIKNILYNQPSKCVHISGENVDEVTWVLAEVYEGEIKDCAVDSVFIYEDDDLVVTVTATFGKVDIFLSETPYLFASLKWLISICNTICKVPGLDPENGIM